MSVSSISRLTTDGRPDLIAATMAKEAANREIQLRFYTRQLNPDDHAGIEREYKSIYSREYYKFYAHLNRTSRIIYVPCENPSARKFVGRHAVVRFSKLNNFIHVHRDCITVGRISIPIDEEATLSTWPGPLDRCGDKLNLVNKYLDTLWDQDSQRRFRYCIAANDDQRKTILNLLSHLLQRNGSLDARNIARLLLKPEQIEYQKDEGNRNLLENLKKLLLLGKRSEAIEFAESKKLWIDAVCLELLDKYQPPRTENYYVKDGSKLKDSTIQLIDKYINDVEDVTLHTVYRSLMNRIIKTDPKSVNVVKHPNVANDSYRFAILSANDCEMEFDQSNELFKLISAVKQSDINSTKAYSHLISLGHITTDTCESDDISFRSHVSFLQGDTYFSRTLTISNIDMLILNEIWEYCLNLRLGTCNQTNYNYIINLVPYKLLFAAKLLDWGLHGMFSGYLSSIKNALVNAPMSERDQFYDWDTIQRSVEYLGNIWDIYVESPEISPLLQSQSPDLISPNHNAVPHAANYLSENQTDYLDSGHNNEYPSLPYQGESVFAPSLTNQQVQHNIPPRPSFYQQLPQPPIRENLTDFNIDSPRQVDSEVKESYQYEHHQHQTYNDYSNESSRRPSAALQSMDLPAFSPPSFGPPSMISTEQQDQSKPMTSSSPVNSKSMDHSMPGQILGESFNSPFSPINEYDDMPKQEAKDQYGAGGSNTDGGKNVDSSNTNNNNQPSGDNRSSFLSTITKYIPKSSSKHMILPDDSDPAIVYDEQLGGWVDKTKPKGEDSSDILDAPPMMPTISKPPSYSMSTKSRYPKAQF